ncbi:MAG: hypothetical protein C0490_19865 [Marivirga sp.]|jgi:hypothetical protein|nr:hypothetical protein [Marivirga sp.]
MKSSFMNEEVTLRKSDGSVSKKLFAVISRYTIIAEDAGLEIGPGDFIFRTKRDGQVESYCVVSADHKTPEGKPSIYQMRVKVVDDIHLA